MKLTLDYNPPVSDHPITHKHKILLVGSCFSENIGIYLRRHRFQCEVNPGGIIFDAVSLARLLSSAVGGQTNDDAHLVERGGMFFSYLYHSSVSAPSAEEMQKKHSDIQKSVRTALADADILIVTLGTAFTYFHTEKNLAVSNCHKQPGSQFRKQLITPGEIVTLFTDALTDIRNVNKKLRVIFTVSPVKYLKDGPENNNLSKSSLLLAVNEVVRKIPDCHYFPAYELVTDDLRDYRFYKEDLSHPNELAIKYVWEKFSDTWFSDDTKKLNLEIGKLNNALSHRVLHDHPEEKKKLAAFIRKQQELVRKMEPSIEF